MAKDLDIHLFTRLNLKRIAYEVHHKLSEVNLNLDIETENLQDSKNSIYINIKNYYEWQIDIWITNDIKFTGFNMAKELKRKLNYKKRRIIIGLKEYYYDKNLLYGEMSTLIYKAVLNKNINNLEEFKDYLNLLNNF